MQLQNLGCTFGLCFPFYDSPSPKRIGPIFDEENKDKISNLQGPSYI